MNRSIRTMEQFSAFVGLSRPTVSKYFNNPHAVREVTRQRIESALAQSGFQPNLLAVNLKRRQSKILGIVIPSAAAPFYQLLTRRIQQIVTDNGYLAFVLSSEGKPELEVQAIRTFAAMNVAGTLIAPLGECQQRSLLHDVCQDMPLVAMDSPLDEITDFVGSNNVQGMRLLVDYLCETGDPPTYFGMPAVNSNAKARERGYIDSMQRLGLVPRVVTLPHVCSWEFEKFAFDLSLQILSSQGFATNTVLCANDRLATGVLAAAYKLGISIGRKGAMLRVAGHDNHPQSAFTGPPLTTAAQDCDEIGRLVTEIMFRKLSLARSPIDAALAVDGANILLDARLVIRDSA